MTDLLTVSFSAEIKIGKVLKINKNSVFKSENIICDYGGTNIFLSEENSSFGLKIMFIHDGGSYTFFHKTHPDERTNLIIGNNDFEVPKNFEQINSEQEKLFFKHTNFLAEHKLTPKIFKKTLVELNGFVFVAYFVEKVKVCEELNEFQLKGIREKFLRFFEKYEVYEKNRFPKPILDDTKIRNFGFLKDGTLVHIDTFAWKHYFYSMNKKYINWILSHDR